MKVYADNATATKMSKAAVDAMPPYIYEEYGNPSSLYSLGQKSAEAFLDAREKFTAVLNYPPMTLLH
ncbi:MAG: aminotransferase class V-fold PLP-dependent enzyme [Lachnospiraceae bacterium]|nr:aminotransferase class V-fold PLP-dependent enzyme [Lachnospiraceae bacterium]